VLGSFITVAINLVIIQVTLAPLQHRAIALSTSLSVIVNFLFLAVVLYYKVSGYQVRQLFVKLTKITGASVIMGLSVFWLYGRAVAWLGTGLAGRTLALSGVIAVGLAFYVALVSQLQIPEFQELMQYVRNRLKRS
jgi:putative peptidoglycan lipid II flippase